MQQSGQSGGLTYIPERSLDVGSETTIRHLLKQQGTDHGLNNWGQISISQLKIIEK